MKTLGCLLSAVAFMATAFEVHAMTIPATAQRSDMVVQVADGCGPGKYRGPGGACHLFGRGPYPNGYYRPYRSGYGGPGNGCGAGWYRGPGGACHPLGRGPYPGGYWGPYRY
jgi:hypothetical protein